MRINGTINSFLLVFFLFASCFGVGLDKDRYIGIDEITPGMEAYCLTCYKGTEVEKFGLEVVDVVYNIGPGRNAILVQGTDERFIHTGPVAGCSGSPVYIEGRLAGALAFMWAFSKDPLYGVTPIEEMLRAGTGGSGQVRRGVSLDLSGPIDFKAIENQMRSAAVMAGSRSGRGVSVLPNALIASGFGQQAFRELDSYLGPMGFEVISAAGGGLAAGGPVELSPGSSLMVPLVSGDMSLTAVGTVTEIVDEDVYAFGHGFLGYGSVEMPMATAKIHTVVSNIMRSFKLASSVEIVGAITADESTAIRGRLGQTARTIPVAVKVDRYNDTERRIYNCQVVDNEFLTSLLLASVVGGAGSMSGGFPPYHTLEYKAVIRTEGFEPIVFENVSTGFGFAQLLREIVGTAGLLMNNPYRKVAIESLDFELKITDRSVVSHIWSVELSETRVKAGDEVEVSVIVESFLGPKKEYKYVLDIPETLGAGSYDLIVAGEEDYRDFLRKSVSHRFIPEDIKTLFEALDNSLGISRDRLYCVFVLGHSGVTIERAELPDLPATRAVVLQNPARTLRIRPYQNWREKSFDTGTVVIDKAVVQITVEE